VVGDVQGKPYLSLVRLPSPEGTILLGLKPHIALFFHHGHRRSWTELKACADWPPPVLGGKN
jgi:hypothetical protein